MHKLTPALLLVAGSSPGAAAINVVVFLCSPRMRTYQEMQQSGIFFSDIPLHDMSADYLLLAEQRKADADMMEKYERLSLELKVWSCGAPSDSPATGFHVMLSSY